MKGGAWCMHKNLKLLALTTMIVFIVPIIAMAASYVGNLNSYKFHYQSCRMAKKMKQSNRIYFDSRQEAVNRGMKPCGVCRP